MGHDDDRQRDRVAPPDMPTKRPNDDAPASSPPSGAGLDPRARILQATKELLAEAGWNRTTTRKVAERAGVNNALVHYYFGTKRALLLQAATDVLFAEFGGAFEALEAGGDLARGVRAALDWLAQSGPGGASSRVVAELTLQAMHDPALQESLQAMLRDFRAGVAAMAVDEGLSERHAKGLATILAALLDGLYLHALLDRELDLGAAAAALAPLFHREDV